jgi:hypothetical protein
MSERGIEAAACVRVGTKYGREYVARLAAMAYRCHPGLQEFYCITDDPVSMPGVTAVRAEPGLDGWWATMALFKSEWRRGRRVTYFDLDTVLCGYAAPLWRVEAQFGVCANFTRASGNLKWPCRYGSCVMTLREDLKDGIWQEFVRRGTEAKWLGSAHRYGDQYALERIAPNATLLQDVLPAGFFLGYRDLQRHQDGPPPGCAAVIFAGRHKPDNTTVPWVRERWTT